VLMSSCFATAVGLDLSVVTGCTAEQERGLTQAGSGGGVSDDGGAAGPVGGAGGSAGAAGSVPNEAPWSVTFGMGGNADEPSWFAYFRSYWHSGPDERCYARPVGEMCFRFDCRPPEDGDRGIAGPSAGPVTISGWAGADVVLAPTESGVASAEGDGVKWWPGDNVRMSAPGEVLPGFDLGFVFPDAADLLEPDVESAVDGEIVVDLSEPFALSWAPTDERLDVELWQGSLGTGVASLILACYFPGVDGAGELPLEGLAGFEAGPEAPVTHLGVAHLQLAERALGGRPFLAGAFNWTARIVELE
jgi:hypothetical protein